MVCNVVCRSKKVFCFVKCDNILMKMSHLRACPEGNKYKVFPIGIYNLYSL